MPDSQPQNSGDSYRIVTETASDAILTMDAGSVILSVNPAAERIFGYTAAEMVDQPLAFLMPERFRESHRRGVRRYLETGVRRIRWDGVQLPGLHKSGREIPLEISFGSFLRDGEPVFTGIIRDVSERVEQQRTLEETAAELEMVVDELRARTEELEAAQDWSTFLIETSRILSSSLDYETTLSRVAERVVPKIADWCFIDLVQPEGSFRRLAVTHADPADAELAQRFRRDFGPRPDASRGTARVVRTHEPEMLSEIDESVLESIAADAEHLDNLRALNPASYISVPLIAREHMLGVLTLLCTESGRRYGEADLARAEDLAGRAAMAIDNARLYAESEEGNRAKAEFLAVMSHELRTPLSGILGYTELLTDGIMGAVTEGQKGYLGRIKSGALHLLRLIEEILSFSQVEAGREDVQREHVDARSIVRDAAEAVEPEMGSKGLRLRMQLPDQPLHMETDAAKLRQVLLNLFSNAVKFTDSGEVHITARQEVGAVVFSVADTGVGIEPEHREVIFEPFRQLDQTTTRTVGGTGLGLSVTRSLARLLGGDVAVRSELGQGSTFIVRIPSGGAASAEKE
jgi:PAS domain S-box-containing protein